MYEQVCSYLTLHDIMLLVVTLECMYALTTLGEKACDYIVRVHGVMDTLVSLITVEVFILIIVVLINLIIVIIS